MRNHSFYELSTQAKYQEFNIRASESGLYLSLTDKRLDASSIFEEPEYGFFELEDIHVTALEQYEINRKFAVRSDKSSSPFHITLRFSEPDSGRALVIHDFYSPLDLSRDFHVQLKEGEVTTYLPAQTINLRKLNQLIEKEMRLVKELIDKNNKHEHDLRCLIDAIYEDLFSRAQQANLLPDMIDESEHQHFHQSLVKIIAHLEQLIYLGHHHESRRLSHAQRELEHLRASSPNTSPTAQKGEAAEEKALTKASKASSQKTASKKGKAQKQKNGAQVQLTAFLNSYYAEAQALKVQKHVFIKDAHRYLLAETQFDPAGFWGHLNQYLDILIQCSNFELQSLIMDFFEQFSVCQDQDKQRICFEIAEFLSLNVMSFATFMRELSLMSYAYSYVRISPILMAFINNNMPYWAFMHAYGVNFADNRHIIIDGAGGNILHGIFFLISHIPAESVNAIIPFVQLLFQYLEEDGCKLTNLKTIGAIVADKKKKVSALRFFQKKSSEVSSDIKTTFKDFIDNINQEPYGSVLIMEDIEFWLIRSKAYPTVASEEKLRLNYSESLSIGLLTVVLPHISTSALLKILERLLVLQVLGIFDEHFSDKSSAGDGLPALDLLSEFSLVYSGTDYKEPMSRLLDELITLLTKRVSVMGNSALSSMMQHYYMQSKTNLREVSENLCMIPNARDMIPQFQVNHKLSFARIAYFLLIMKAKRGLFLTIEDYRVFFNFYQLLFTEKEIRFTKDNPEYDHQRGLILYVFELIESTIEVLDIPETVKMSLRASPEFQSLLEVYQRFRDELPKPSPDGFGR